ncbi:hypothetical protein DM01DRAFT_1315413 [Hesseltinella vesiculosa]|uniref:C2 domain-containing protein n=1 Tax=Hesseltinella vesiculosa TaxID=101127 RepID=A0A1X2GVL4_9FUNG|nr:hypothetical protein DM01DRAFT_1315413 [Hesseltinella vesiculosa]
MFSHHANPEGTLQVTVVEARKLKDEDLIGKNDPYVELWLDSKYKQRTKTLNGTNDPVFNQTFTFPLSRGSSDHKLHFQVFDKDTIGSDEVGKCSVDFADVVQGRPVDDWFKLKGSTGLRSHGDLHLVLSFVPSY